VKNRNILPITEIEPRIAGHPARSLVTIPIPVCVVTESSPLPALQPCEGFDVLYGFVTVHFFGWGL
jgi:hypothetical protein